MVCFKHLQYGLTDIYHILLFTDPSRSLTIRTRPKQSLTSRHLRRELWWQHFVSPRFTLNDQTQNFKSWRLQTVKNGPLSTETETSTEEAEEIPFSTWPFIQKRVCSKDVVKHAQLSRYIVSLRLIPVPAVCCILLSNKWTPTKSDTVILPVLPPINFNTKPSYS